MAQPIKEQSFANVTATKSPSSEMAHKIESRIPLALDGFPREDVSVKEGRFPPWIQAILGSPSDHEMGEHMLGMVYPLGPFPTTAKVGIRHKANSLR